MFTAHGDPRNETRAQGSEEAGELSASTYLPCWPASATKTQRSLLAPTFLCLCIQACGTRSWQDTDVTGIAAQAYPSGLFTVTLVLGLGHTGPWSPPNFSWRGPGFDIWKRSTGPRRSWGHSTSQGGGRGDGCCKGKTTPLATHPTQETVG